MGSIVVASLIACGSGDKSPAADSLKAIDTVRALEPSTVDSATQQPPPAISAPARTDSASRGKLPPTGGETYKRGGTMAPLESVPRKDPPPNLTGETRKIGGTMAPERRARDSTYGPKLMIDSKGNVTPIRR